MFHDCAIANRHRRRRLQRQPSKWNIDFFLFCAFLIFVKKYIYTYTGIWCRHKTKQMDEWQAAQFSKPFPMYYKYILLPSDVYLNTYIFFARNNRTLAVAVAAATYVLCNIQSSAETRRFNGDRHLGNGLFVRRRCHRCGNRNRLHLKQLANIRFACVVKSLNRVLNFIEFC